MARPRKQQRAAPAATATAAAAAVAKKKSVASAPLSLRPRVLGLESPLLPVLRLGDNCMLQFLALRDAPSLLNCCRAFRHDSELALHALLADPTRRHISAHLLQQCEFDWCDLSVLRTSTGFDDARCSYGCFGSVSASSTECRAFREHCAAGHRSAMPTQLVTLVAAFDQCVLPLCDALAAVSEIACCDDWSTIPVMIPIPTAPSTGLALPDDSAVGKALNVLRAGFGDAFVREDTPPFVSLFGAHWDSIQRASDSDAGCFGDGDGADVVCRLCAAKDEALEVHQERKQEHRALMRHERWTERCEAMMDFGRDEELDDEARFEIMAERRAAGDFDGSDEGSSEDYDSEDDGVEAMIAAGELRFEPFGRHIRFPPAELAKALESCGYVEICTRFAQPLKRVLLTHCTRVRRIQCSWIAAPATWSKRAVGEFVGGVTSSGYLCGVLVVQNSE